MKINCLEIYSTNRLAKEKHADFMIKTAEIIIALVFAGLLSVPALELVFSTASTGIAANTQTSFPLREYWAVIGIGSIAAVWMMIQSLKIYATLDDLPQEISKTLAQQGKEGEIQITCTSATNILINSSSSKISIRIEPTAKENS